MAAAKAHYCIDYHQSRPECGSLRGNFTALVSSTGQQIQRILDQLDGLEIADNTWVIITSDNGSVFRTDSKTLLPDRSLRGNKDMVFDGGLAYTLYCPLAPAYSTGRGESFCYCQLRPVYDFSPDHWR
ncbi:MAG TPA: sulfatase-like hydrolase/transferase [Gammaproteobacteria bacterium]|nr:sulfatase-like hydrolase/transferase [Gammaproteobacteria bacterium]